MAYIVNGLIPQLIIRVINTGFGVFADFITCVKSIFTMIGYIIKNKQMAIGIETWYMEKSFRAIAKSGAFFPIKIPAKIQSSTQIVRYCSKKDSFLVFVTNLILSFFNF